MTAIYYTFRADFFDRVRRRNYLVILLCMVILTMIFFPGADAKYATVRFVDYRGLYNSAWIGASLAILNASFLPIICFYLVKNAVERDRDRGISELIAATPVTKVQYLLGKWISNLSLLMGIMVVMSVTSLFVQLWYGESYTIDPIALFLPQLLYVFPILAAISAAAILFETIPILRGGLGNVAYFFLWAGVIAGSVTGGTGTGDVIEQMRQALLLHDPQSTANPTIGISTGAVKEGEQIKTFVWSGMVYTSAVFVSIATALGISAVFLGAATLIFDRFKRAKDHSQSKTAGSKFARKLAKLTSPLGKLFEAVTNPWSFTRLVRQECLLLIRGGSVWWYLILAGFGLAQLLAPLEAVRAVAVPGAWILCVLTFSPMGHRELQQGADQLIFSCLSPIKKQFPAMLLGGFLIAFMVVSPAFVRFIVSGEWFSAVMLLSGALFIVSLALACGSLTRTSRTFEILFTAIWYMGPLNRSPLDFVGVDPVASQAAGAPFGFLVASLCLIAAALQGRRWQMGG
jgi:ABC-type transport system involved in multi-copper enzyme maturation permease subunit